METPVLYFYTPRETTASVNVSFAKGIITEYRRFQTPISMAAAKSDPSRVRELQGYLNTAYSYACQPPQSGRP
jgi:hypothetical protein